MASNEIGRRIARGDAETAMRIAVAGEAERAREQAVGSVAQVAEGGAVSGDPSWEGKLAALETALISAGVPVDAGEYLQIINLFHKALGKSTKERKRLPIDARMKAMLVEEGFTSVGAQAIATAAMLALQGQERAGQRVKK